MDWFEALFPGLLVCGLFGVIVLVGIGFSYLWLVWLGGQAIKCPECGKRGAGELVESKVTDLRVYAKRGSRPSIFDKSAQRPQIQMTEKRYEDRFVCQYCGHRWVITAQGRSKASADLETRKTPQ